MALEQLCRVDIHYPIPLTPSLPPPWYPTPKTSSAKTLHPTLLLSQIHFVFWLRLAFYIKLRINDTREASEDHTLYSIVVIRRKSWGVSPVWSSLIIATPLQ